MAGRGQIRNEVELIEATVTRLRFSEVGKQGLPGPPGPIGPPGAHSNSGRAQPLSGHRGGLRVRW